MRSSTGFAVLVGLGTTALAVSALAEHSRRIRTSFPASCETAARELDARLERALGRGSTTNVDASVAIEHDRTGYRVVIGTSDPSRNAEKVLLAPSCDEAVDAAVVVLALAFTVRDEAKKERALDAAVRSEPARGEPARSFTRAEARPPRRSPFRGTPAGREGFDEARGNVPRHRPASIATTRLSLATGGDTGTLPSPTLLASAGISRSFSCMDVEGHVSYGFPVSDERVETESTESLRYEFAAVDVRACRGTGETFRVSACAGGEFAAVRIRHQLETENGIGIDEDSVTPRVSAVLGALFSRRGGVVEPAVELSGVAVAFGREKGASVLILRATVGAAVAF
jgi:hypothetical protein